MAVAISTALERYSTRRVASVACVASARTRSTHWRSDLVAPNDPTIEPDLNTPPASSR